jgi:uncharacterized membrane protein YfcA
MDATLLPTLVAGAMAGLVLGAVGGGGSVLLIPLLVIGFGLDAHDATGTALAVVLAAAMFGTVVHARAGAVRYREALLFGGPGMVASALASPVNARLPEAAILVVVALLMIAVALRMWQPVQPSEGRKPAPVVIAAGALSGALTGVFGVGGGFIIVPALVLALGLPMAEAVGTSLLVIAANAASALVGYGLRGDVDGALAIVLALGAVFGVLFGSTIARAAGEQRLRQSFAVLLVVVAAYLTVWEATLVA